MTITSIDIAGSGRLQLEDATARDLALVAPFVDLSREAPTTTPALLSVRFVDRLAEAGPRRLVGSQHATDDAGLLMRSGAGWARIPLGDDAAGQALVCERRVDEVPHLVDLLNLAALSSGALPLHAAGLVRNGEGVLLVGWSRGGKTEAVLAATAAGDLLVGDEWMHLAEDGVMRPVGYRMRLWGWQLEQSPALRRRLTGRQRLRLQAVGAVRRLAPARLEAPFARRHGVYLRPEVAFPGQLVSSSRVDRVVLLESHSSDDVTAQPLAAAELVARVCTSNQFERRGLAETYSAYRYGRPQVVDARLEQVDALEQALAARLLSRIPATVVAHPYPVALERLAGVL